MYVDMLATDLNLFAFNATLIEIIYRKSHSAGIFCLPNVKLNALKKVFAYENNLFCFFFVTFSFNLH